MSKVATEPVYEDAIATLVEELAGDGTFDVTWWAHTPEELDGAPMYPIVDLVCKKTGVVYAFHTDAQTSVSRIDQLFNGRTLKVAAIAAQMTHQQLVDTIVMFRAAHDEARGMVGV